MMVDRVHALRASTATLAVALGAMTALACGSSSDDVSKSADAATKTTAAAAAQPAPAATTTTAAPAASTAAPTTTTPAPTGNLNDGKRAWQEAGTVRLAAVRTGTQGGVSVKPAGLVYKKWNHWYKPGTQVTVRAVDTQVGRFAGWSGGSCEGKGRTCSFTVTGTTRVIVGFLLNEKGAKKLKPDDPRLTLAALSDGVR
jgi:hypothetical protein